MSYNQQNFKTFGMGTNGDPTTQGPAAFYTYYTSVDDASVVMTAGYGFEANIYGLTVGNAPINVGTVMYLQTADFPLGFFAVVTAIDSTTYGITLTAVPTIMPGTGVGTFTTVTGSATQTFTLTGAAVGDIVLVIPQTGANYIESSSVTSADTVTAIFSADPPSGVLVSYIWVRRP